MTTGGGWVKPNNGWLICKGKSHLEMDDLEVPYFRKPPHLEKHPTIMKQVTGAVFLDEGLGVLILIVFFEDPGKNMGIVCERTWCCNSQ